MPDSLFISYRRDDAAGDAGRLADHLVRRFGKERVFIDVDTITPGIDFTQALRESLQRSAAALVVIGPRWATLTDARGQRRLDDPDDFVRLEVAASLARKIPVVPVLVQGAKMPRKEDLPASLAALANRQAAEIDHDAFRDDAERLCDRIERLIAGPPLWRRWWPAAAMILMLAIGIAGYVAKQANDRKLALDAEVTALLAQATAQRDRNQFLDALDTLSAARKRAPAAAAVRDMHEDVAMEWIRNARVEAGKSSFGDVIKPALAVVDDALAAATGARRADLLAHAGFGQFLMFRDGDRRLDPAAAYRAALALDPGNPYANAMLAHWMLFQNDDDLPRALTLFDVALESGRAAEEVRSLQWSAYGNARTPEANAARIKAADAMRRAGAKLHMRQAQDLWAPYFFALSASRERDRQTLLAALPADDHILTLAWAFEEYAAKDAHRRRTIRYYVALLDAAAGRREKALQDLQGLQAELKDSSNSLSDAVQKTLARMRTGAGSRAGH